MAPQSRDVEAALAARSEPIDSGARAQQRAHDRRVAALTRREERRSTRLPPRRDRRTEADEQAREGGVAVGGRDVQRRAARAVAARGGRGAREALRGGGAQAVAERRGVLR